MITVWSLALAITAAAPPDGDPAAIAAAKKALETARANLTKAAERIQADPPSASDLDAAHEAVEALKAAIESGAALEPKDLDYAKIALAARKELRVQREYVDQKRAHAEIHESWRKIDAAMDALNAALHGLDDPKATKKSFDDARTAAKQVERTVEAGRRFLGQDAKYTTHVAEVRNALNEKTRSIDGMETHALVQKQRALVEDSRTAFQNALGALDHKKPSDAEFDAADGAVTKTAKILDDGKALEKNDRDYRAYAAEVREQIEKARKRIETLWGETGLQNLKAEIEPVRADLVQAKNALAQKAPSEEQIGEARTAAIVLQKLVDKLESRASRSKPGAQYLQDVKKSLVEVEIDLSRRSLAAARDRVAKVMKPLATRSASDEAFQAADEALKDAQKVLEEAKRWAKEDRTFATYFDETKKKITEAANDLSTRRREIDTTRMRATLESAKNDLERALRALERRAPTDEQFGEANSAAIVLEKTLETAPKKDAELAAYVQQMKTLLHTAKQTLEKRRLEVDVDRQRAKVEAARNELASALTKALRANTTPERLDAVDSAVEHVREALAEGTQLVQKDRSYRDYDHEVKKRLEEAKAKVATERQTLTVDAQKAKVDAALKAVARAQTTLEASGGKGDAFSEVEKALEGVDAAFTSGAELEKKIATYAAWSKQARKTLEAAKARFQKKKLSFAAGDTRDTVKEMLSSATAALDVAKRPEATEKDVQAASEKVKALIDALTQGASFEKDDRAYAAFAAQVKRGLDRVLHDLDVATQAELYRRQTLEPLLAGISAADGAAKSQVLRAQRDGYEKAMTSFKSCERNGSKMLADNAAFRATPAIFEGRQIDGKEVIARCSERAGATQQELKRVLGLLGFEEGPKASFEKGKSLLESASKTEALAQFEECISSGRILEHKNPELKEKAFEVAGGEMTLHQVVDACTKEAHKLRGK
jgi:hypothetical protein